jgi:hypothetical protein
MSATTVAAEARTVQVPEEFLEEVAGLRFPPSADRRMQELMDRSSAGTLTPAERAELEAYAELSEAIAVVRGGALRHLGRRPGNGIP